MLQRPVLKKNWLLLITFDDIKSYSSRLNTSSLLEKSSYTGWLLHTYLNKPSSLFKMDKKNQLYKRPVPRKKDDNIETNQFYQGSISSISGQTASAAKQSLEWPDIDLTKKLPQLVVLYSTKLSPTVHIHTRKKIASIMHINITLLYKLQTLNNC